MTLRAAVQSILQLTGTFNVCSCADSPLITAAVNCINRAFQTLNLSPQATYWRREVVELTFTESDAVAMSSDVQTVVGPVTIKNGPSVALAATRPEFDRFFAVFNPTQTVVDRIAVATPWASGFAGSTIIIPAGPHQRRIVILIDDEDSNAFVAADKYLPSDIMVRVNVPSDTLLAAPVRNQIVLAINSHAEASELMEATPVNVGSAGAGFDITRRAAAVTGPTVVTGGAWDTDFTERRSPNYPLVAYAETVLTASGTDPVSITLRIAPPPLRVEDDDTKVILQVTVIKSPTVYTVDDVGAGVVTDASTTLRLPHGYAESMLVPIAKWYFLTDYPTLVSPDAMGARDVLRESHDAALDSLGLAHPAAPGKYQRDSRRPTDAHA